MIPSISVNTSLSIFPLNGLGATVKYSPCKAFDLLAGVFDGDVGDPDENIHNTNINLRFKQLFTVVEGAAHFDLPAQTALPGTIKLGAWHNSSDVPDVAEVDDNGDPVMHDDNYGAYALLDQQLFKEADDQGLSFVYIGGLAPQKRNTVRYQNSFGLNYAGLLPSRDKDVAGIAMTQSKISKKLRDVSSQDPAESTYELTYRFEVNDNIHIQPDFQYVQRPNADDNIKNASVFMLRSDIQF